MTENISRIIGKEKNEVIVLKQLAKLDKLLIESKSHTRIKRWLKFSSDKELIEHIQKDINRAMSKLEKLYHKIKYMHS